MLAVCVKGIFMKLDYPLGQFPTTSNTCHIKKLKLFFYLHIAVSGQDLCEIVWTAVKKLKVIGLEVVLVVAEGVSTNKKFFKLHNDPQCIKDGLIYMTMNIYDPSK